MLNKSNIVTILGALVAIASAYANIDWETFDIKVAWPQLLISGVIALGAYFTEIRTKKNK